jgi:F-type H+-transporting ATPase subunit b
MESVLNVSPGLMIWTLFNFAIVLLLVIKFGVKPIINGLKAREDGIRQNISDAEQANLNARKLLNESEEKLRSAQHEMAEIVQKGRHQAEELIKKAAEEADRIKNQKVDEAIKEISRSKEIAIGELRSEVAELVVLAAEKLLSETMDKEKHQKLVESFIDKLPKN